MVKQSGAWNTSGAGLAGVRRPGAAGELEPRHALHGVLGVGEPGEAAHKADLDVADAQVEARQQDRGRHVARRQHERQVLRILRRF